MAGPSFLCNIGGMMIEEYPGAVPVALCDEIVAQFERDPARHPSAVVVDGYSQANDVRSGTMLAIDRSSPDWERLFMAVVPAMRSTMDSYMAKYPGLAGVVEWEGLDCSLPLIEKVEPGQGFSWHYDHTLAAQGRMLAGLLYLRTVRNGGQTEFAHQNKLVQPEAGKIVLFPPFWTHIHRGVTPVGESKYVMSYFWNYPETPATKA